MTEKKSETPSYSGPYRRRQKRRGQADRRTTAREGPERRNGPGRRQADKDWAEAKEKLKSS